MNDVLYDLAIYASKAFDMSHERLAAKLHHYVVRGPTLNWIKGYAYNFTFIRIEVHLPVTLPVLQVVKVVLKRCCVFVGFDVSPRDSPRTTAVFDIHQ
jgi:hypothetical protein